MAVVDRHRMAGLRQRQADRAAEALGAARDKCTEFE
jgi:hypothetical protein